MSGDATRITIVGGGPIGLACALLLAHRGIDSVVVEARPRAQGAPAGIRRRLLALSRGTLDILDSLPAVPVRAMPMAPILEVRVSSAGEFGAVRLEAAELGGRPLGAGVFYADLLAALARGVEASPRIALRDGRRAVGIAQLPQHVDLQLDDGSRMSSAIVIDAEGTISAAGRGLAAPPSEAAGLFRGPRVDVALTGDVVVDGLASGTAIERFTRDGPLALLPMPASGSDLAGAAERKRSLVWCMNEDAARERLALARPSFVAELQRALGTRHGRIADAGPAVRVDLRHQWRTLVRTHRLAYIGNAAQSLHPVAGQGFNLGIRDCATLADCLDVAPSDPIDALARYARRRSADRLVIATLTGQLPDLFASRAPLLALARSAGMTLLAGAAPLRHGLAQLLMFGVRSDPGSG